MQWRKERGWGKKKKKERKRERIDIFYNSIVSEMKWLTPSAILDFSHGCLLDFCFCLTPWQRGYNIMLHPLSLFISSSYLAVC
jgi:hypothetical protein